MVAQILKQQTLIGWQITMKEMTEEIDFLVLQKLTMNLQTG